MEEKSSDTLEKIQQAALEEFSEKGIFLLLLQKITAIPVGMAAIC